MSELEIDLEPFAVHFALTGSGDSPYVVISTPGSGRAAGTVPESGKTGTVPV